jgi:hypothetical protein
MELIKEAAVTEQVADKSTASEEKPPVRVTSLAEVDDICRKPIQAEVKIHGRTCVFPVRLLMDEESERLDRILNDYQPPLIDGDPDEQGKVKKVFNYADKDFQKHAKRAMRLTRALALWWTCPIFRQAAEKLPTNGTFEYIDSEGDPLVPKTIVVDLKNRDFVMAFVGAKLPDKVLDQLEGYCRMGQAPKDEEERTAF